MTLRQSVKEIKRGKTQEEGVHVENERIEGEQYERPCR